MAAPPRVVITGMGMVTPLGAEIDTVWQNLIAGKSGIAPITFFDATDFSTRFAGEVKNFDASGYLERKDSRWMDRFTQLTVVAGDKALVDAGLTPQTFPVDPERIGVVIGSGQGGLEVIQDGVTALVQRGPRRVSPFFVPGSIVNMASGALSIRYGTLGANHCVVSACATGVGAIGDGYHMIRRGDADMAIVGGVEAAITGIGMAGFCSARAMSARNDDPEHASRPFDADRDGFVMAEGAAVLILETLEGALNRGARIWAEIGGVGLASDAYHITNTHPEGRGAIGAMRNAIRAAHATPDQVGYINAHATSTEIGDAGEAKAINTFVGGRRVPVSSTKSMTGHMLGAAGAAEAAFTVLALHHQILPPTINQFRRDPNIDLDTVPNEARHHSFDLALSNAFGFGGSNASIALRRWQGV